VEIEGPLHEQWPPRGHQLLYGDLPLQPANPAVPGKDLRVVSAQPEADAQRLLLAFLPKVFRRPVGDAEVDGYLTLVKEQMAKGRRFDELLTHDLSVRNVVQSDFAMLNERLAEHYGIAGVKGDQIRKVTLPPGSDIRYYTQGLPVDPSYALADGRTFKDVDGFKQLILANPGQLAHCVTEKLIAHLTGANLQFADREVVESIVAKTKARDYGLRSLLHEVIQSRVFTQK